MTDATAQAALKKAIAIDFAADHLMDASDQLAGREAVMNALHHSEATSIEVEIHYLRDLLRVSVRDNGIGINPDAVQEAMRSHWGLCGMRERAESIGARFGIWSRRGAGTDVRVAVPIDAALAPA